MPATAGANDTPPHRHSARWGTQAVLDLIHNADHHLLSNDRAPRGDQIEPIYAFMTPNAAGFKTDCSDPRALTWREFRIGTSGAHGRGCARAPYFPNNASVEPGEFAHALARIAAVIKRRTSVTTSQVPRGISGTITEVTLTFNYDPHRGGQIESISIFRDYTTRVVKTKHEVVAP